MGVKFLLRPNQERGHADLDWLKSFHSFSVAGYFAPAHMNFGALRVMNEDRVAPRTGFGPHSHREFEIFSYIVSGQLEHKDSMGNIEILRRGDIQLTSAGTGIAHSENAHGHKEVHFLQIWSQPSVARLTPKYFTRHFSDTDKQDRWARVVAPVGADDVTEERNTPGPAPVHSPLTLYATLLSSAKHVTQTMSGRKGYIQVVQTSGYNPGRAIGGYIRVQVAGDADAEIELKEGDGAYIHFENDGEAELTVHNIGHQTAEVLLFDLE
ncbi:putative quercetin 2,3-dioxygenase [Mycena indigotica]|uniref:Putative quercetin 2,3-dioxygenase n=1 Tax=Mycena indigotica TaxID=2126181 RepID=A0A8H6T348_9AGAR|nr:putative quercetin 2,3-dioxygenase [Mycena indigotica]KAF7309386.1 putative quercetin 2,3-dioxygenase [Mycena indigotica]